MKKRSPLPRTPRKGPPAPPRAAARRGRDVRLLELLEALARAANEAATPEAAMRVCVEHISAYAGWIFGRVAILRANPGVPAVETSLWVGRDPQRYSEFVRVSEGYDYSRLSGRFISVVLREKRAVWIEDFGKANAPGRLRDAMKAGLHSGFAFPVIVQGRVAAFLEFFAAEPRRADPLLIEAIGSVGAQLARLIERGRAEAARAQLAAIVQGSQDAIYSRALDGTVLSWNAGAERMFGYTAAEMIGQNISSISAPEFAHESKRNTEALLRGEAVPPFETVRLAKGGRPVDVQISVSPIHDAAGHVTAIAAIMRDIGERKRVEAERAQLATIVESSQDAIVSTAPDRTIRTWNAGAERLFGYTEAEAVGRDVGFLVPEDLRRDLGQRRAIALTGEQARPHDTERLTKDGRRIPVSISASPLKDAAGNITGVALIYRDINELKRAQRELEQKAALSQLMESLARAANEAASAETAMQSCLRLISEYGRWTLGRVATFAAGQRLGAPQSSVWHCPEPARFAEFIEISNRYSYSGRPSGQFVSEALREGKPVWVPDLSIMRGFGRLADAEKCGLRAGFAFPVAVADESLAFLEFFASEVREPDAPFLEAIGSVSAQLARLIERTRAEAARAQLAAIVENSDDAIVSRDPEHRVLTWNAAAERLFGYKAEEVIGKSISVIIPPDQETQVAHYRELLAAGKAIPASDAVRVTKDGRRIDVSVTQSPIQDQSGKVTGASLIFHDITERKKAEEEIRRLAHYDNLTGLPNRALFYDRLGRAIGLARRERYEVALLYLDLDGFKEVNDAFGHDAGDELLKNFAERIRVRLRESDTVARMGGDEFIVILPKVQLPKDAVTVSEKLIAALSAPFTVGGNAQEVRIGVSIGIAIFPGDGQDRDALVKAADAAMYQAKQTRNSFRFFSPQLDQEPATE